MYCKDEALFKKGDKIDNLVFIYFGVVHLFGTSTWND